MICLLCRNEMDPDNPELVNQLRAAIDTDALWEQRPLEVGELTCERCGESQRWWWFTASLRR